jgi:hypothetical protein
MTTIKSDLTSFFPVRALSTSLLIVMIFWGRRAHIVAKSFAHPSKILRSLIVLLLIDQEWTSNNDPKGRWCWFQ